MRKQKLLVFSDCYIYGGSERLMSFLLKNSEISEHYDITFSFRQHKLYSEGMKVDFVDFQGGLVPLTLLSNDTLFYNLKLKLKNSILLFFLKLLFSIFYFSGLYFVFNFFKFCNLIKRVQPNVLHINNGGFPGARTCSQLAVVAKILKVPVVVYQVNNQARKATLIGRVTNLLVSAAVNQFLTASKLARANLAKNTGISLNKISLVRNVVRLKGLKLEKKNILEHYNLSDDVTILVQVAFLTKRKGQINSIHAIEYLKEKNKSNNRFVLFLIGEGEDEKVLIETVHRLGLEENIFFLGNRSDYHEFLNIADFVLMPSIQDEDMPLVIIESMLLGKCIISSNFAGIGEILTHNESAILLNPDSKNLGQEIATAILELSTDSNKYLRLVSGATFRASEFSEEKYGQQLLSIYNLKENSL